MDYTILLYIYIYTIYYYLGSGRKRKSGCTEEIISKKRNIFQFYVSNLSKFIIFFIIYNYL